MIDHTSIGVADVGRSATFYDAALGALGMRRVMQMPDNAGTDGVGYGFFAKIRNKKQSPIGITSITLPKLPVSLTRGDEVPHISTRKPRL